MKSVERWQTNTQTNKKTYILSKNWGNLFLTANFLFSIFISLIVWTLKKAVSNSLTNYREHWRHPVRYHASYFFNLFQGRTVSLKIKTVAFDLKTRSHTLQYDTNDSNKIFLAAKQLLKTEIDLTAPDFLRLRLMGNITILFFLQF